jgi:hypothetical protein
MQFLKVMPTARATALGDAYSVWASGADAVFWNPSGVALAQHQEFSTTFIQWIFDTRQYAFGYALPLGNIGALGAQFQYVDYGSFEEASASRLKQEIDPGLTGRTFSPYVYLVGITYAKSLTEKFSLGVTFKFAHESLYDQNSIDVIVDTSGTVRRVNTYGNAYLFDFGIRYNTGFRTIQVAASIQNFGPDFTYAVEKDHAPLQFRVGVAADFIGPNSLLYEVENNRLGLAFDLFQPNDYSQQMHLGMEYEFVQTLALRIGYKFNYDNEGFTFGVGLKQKMGNLRLAFDYSYGATGEFIIVGNTHRISLGVELL